METILLTIGFQMIVLVLVRVCVMPFVLGHLDMLVEALRRNVKS